MAQGNMHHNASMSKRMHKSAVKMTNHRRVKHTPQYLFTKFIGAAKLTKPIVHHNLA